MTGLSEAQLMWAHGIRYWHCEHMSREGVWRIPCAEPAVVVYHDGDNVAHGFCAEHSAEGRQQALVHHWRSEPVGAAA